MQRMGLLVTALLVLLSLCAPCPGAERVIGQVKTVTGVVHLTRQAQRYRVSAGALLEQADMLTTEDASRVSFSLIDGARFSLGPRSQMTLKRFTWDATRQEGAAETALAAGTVAVVSGKIAQQPQAMTIQTPQATLGVVKAGLVVEVPQP